MSTLHNIVRLPSATVRPLWTRANEAWLRIDTLPAGPAWSHARDSTNAAGVASAGQRTDDAVFDDNMRYESPDYWYARKACRTVWDARASAHEVAYDLGCGKGRILCLLAQRPWDKVVGIELFEDLAAAARANAAALRGRRAPIHVITSDVLKTDLGEGTVYFLVNPFGPRSLTGVLEKIHESLRSNPRHVQLVYYNAVHDSLVGQSGPFERWKQFHSYGGKPVSFWRTR
jgi:SAM-dependent methyltransferase